MHEIARFESESEPLREIELHAEAEGARHAERAGLDRGAAAERDLEIETTDRSAKPAHFSVRERPDEVAEEKLNRIVLALDDVDEALLTFVDRFEQCKVLARAKVRRLQAEIL